MGRFAAKTAGRHVGWLVWRVRRRRTVAVGAVCLAGGLSRGLSAGDGCTSANHYPPIAINTDYDDSLATGPTSNPQR
jgi:hypothetical protein